MPYSELIKMVSGELPLFESVSDRDEFLKKALELLRQALGADMAAVFIYDDEQGDLAFRVGVDTDGTWDRVNCPDCSDDLIPVRFSLDGNDVGRAFTEGAVIHHSYSDGESDSPFLSKLIVPIARGPVRTGVLILGGYTSDLFAELNDGDVLASVTELGDLIEEASALINKEKSGSILKNHEIHGRKAGGGVAIGTALPFWTDIEGAAASIEPSDSLSENLDRFDSSVEQSIIQLEEIRIKAEKGVSETGSMIFMAQILMLRDESFTGAMRKEIEKGMDAASAVRAVADDYADRFSRMAEQRLAEKAQDVRDLGNRLVTNLSGGTEGSFTYDGRIALARHIFPSDLFRLSLEGVSGVVLMGAAVTAHISILARSLGLPVLITDDSTLLEIDDGARMVLDADSGRLLVEPSEDVFEDFRRRMLVSESTPDSFTLKGCSADGVDIQVLANVNILKDAEQARVQGSEGIGLYRSEFPFILKNDILSEEQQYRVYRSIALSHQDKPVTFRTADIGGDKILQGREEQESNPFLGVRGIRFSLANRSMFRDQLRAMLRAGAGIDLGIMLPMVSGVEEVLEAREEIERAISDLEKRGARHNSKPRIGAMIELPSAALAVDELAAENDFLSIGTNDLTMYLLAVDRTNENLSHLYRNHHPSVLRTLAGITRHAGTAVGEISVCGDAAADPVLTPFFVGIGIRKLSVAPDSVEILKKRLSQFTVVEAEKIAAEMLSIRRIDEMDCYLKDFRLLYGERLGLEISH